MNQQRIGSFIQQLRKERNMTQTQLADKLGVTDRAISNWENGRRMPELSTMKLLCDELDITINELLSGERIRKEDYQEKLEETVLNTIEYSDSKTKKNRLLFNIILCALTVSILLGSMLTTYIQEERRKEQLFMNQIYSKIRDCIVEIDYILENEDETNVQVVHYILYDIAEEIESGYQFVDDSIPSVVSSWFYEMASKTNSVLNEQGSLTNDGIYTLSELNEELKELKSDLVDEEELNLKEMSIKEFSTILKDFYYEK